MSALTFGDLVKRVVELRAFSINHFPGQVGILDQMTTWTEQELARTYDLNLADDNVAHVATAIGVHLISCGRRLAHTDFPETTEQQAAAYNGMIQGINGILQRVAELHGAHSEGTTS